MIPLREDNTSNMTIDKFLETLRSIYHDYFHKSYIYTNKRFAVLESVEGQETFWYCRLRVEPYLQTREEHFYCDSFATTIYITFDIPTAEVTEDEPKMMPKDGITVRSTTHFDIYGKNGEIIKSIPIGWSLGIRELLRTYLIGSELLQENYIRQSLGESLIMSLMRNLLKILKDTYKFIFDICNYRCIIRLGTMCLD